jgi:hypothetical protein
MKKKACMFQEVRTLKFSGQENPHQASQVVIRNIYISFPNQ